MNPLNSPVEAGIRTLVLLTEVFPRRMDLAELVYFDHAVLHSGNLDGGPDSLHPELPISPGEMALRRKLIEQGLTVLMRADLAEIAATEDGFLYTATDEAFSFLSVLEAPYLHQLRKRAEWLISTYFSEETDVRRSMKMITQSWADRALFTGPSQREIEDR
ncbi:MULTISPECIES: ABC-three component system middle component 2 [Rhodococcus]|uniref:ABC-three component system middle component 2 n=1 Tax=Rhodococcus TaxID=1827 RepID=UPI00038DC29D|nr:MULTISPECIES: ABC-three component system middle component 2 [Rhodococcus]AGT95641.1 putative threonine efflux protein [Rhodococcus erythropolis CCM2595]KSU68279.1 threonine transporter [Rhodococcus qingshengii]MCZ9634632.1 hypothetical protein [Rhodococcus sp. BH5]SCC69154.1 hypothetical protein GA0061093_12737 [Rhodococcus qingshengii]SUH12296.1 putative threonine efflux protein [Rhodococcus erythropolis]